MSSFLEQINKKETDAEHQSAQENPKASPTETNTVPNGIRATEHEVVASRRYFRKKLLVGVISAMSVLLVLCPAGFLIRYARLVEIKDFSGRSIAEMRNWAAEYGIVLDEHSIYDESATEGIVLSQDIADGKSPPRSVIAVTVSAGADPSQHIVIPALETKSAAEIRAWISEQKLSAAKTVEEYHDEIEKGKVIRYEFTSVSVNADNFKRNDGIVIYLSKGPTPVTPTESVTVPDYSLVSREDAAAYDAAFEVTVKTAYSDAIPYGGFIRQSVAAGEQVEKSKNRVTVYYSLGMPYLENMTGQSESTLAEMFYDLNRDGAALTYEILYITSDAPKGEIVACSQYDEFVQTGTHITFSVCSRPVSAVSERTVPDFSQIAKENAEQYGEGLAVTVKCRYDNEVPCGGFLGQSVGAGEAVAEGDAVTVTYSLGKPYLPSMTGKTEAELTELLYGFNLSGATLTCEIRYIPASAPKGQIVACSRYNEYIKTGSHLLFSVCSQNTDLIVPDFSLLSPDDAADYGEKFALTVKWIYDDETAYGGFLRQSIRAGEAVADKETAVTVYYSLGKPFVPDLKGVKVSEIAKLFYELNRNGAGLSYELQYIPYGTEQNAVFYAERNEEYVSVGEHVRISVTRR